MLTESLRVSFCNKREPCQAELLGPAQFNDCITETAGSGSLRRIRSVSNVSSNKGTILKHFRGPFSPSHRQLCLPGGVRLRLGGAPAALLCEQARKKGRRGKLHEATAVVSCRLSVPLEEVGVLQFKEIPAALKSGRDSTPAHRLLSYKETQAAKPAVASGLSVSAAGRGAGRVRVLSDRHFGLPGAAGRPSPARATARASRCASHAKPRAPTTPPPWPRAHQPTAPCCHRRSRRRRPAPPPRSVTGSRRPLARLLAVGVSRREAAPPPPRSRCAQPLPPAPRPPGRWRSCRGGL